MTSLRTDTAREKIASLGPKSFELYRETVYTCIDIATYGADYDFRFYCMKEYTCKIDTNTTCKTIIALTVSYP